MHISVCDLYLPDVLEFAGIKLKQTVNELSADPSKHPSYTDPDTGQWKYSGREDWTSGFFAGSLWYMYQLTGDRNWSELAEMWSRDMEPMAHISSDHDTGFRILSSFGNGFRLTENREYREIILQGAASLASRFDAEIGAIKSWEPWEGIGNYPVIIDNLMNLELLFEAAENGGRQEWHDIALSHARTSLKHHMRSNGSSYHIVDFDDKGNVNRKFTTQGYNEDSVWARGQAWAIYGFTMIYRFTRLPEFLDAAVAAADFYLDNVPEDLVPLYDFREPVLALQSRDVSAAAITASALFELFNFTDNEFYFMRASEILNTLSSDSYSTMSTSQSSILTQATLYRGEGERGTSYADYYFLEAIARYKAGLGEEFPDLLIQRRLYLDQNFPNPFAGRTRFTYTIGNAGPVSISVYDLAGRKILTIHDDYKGPGNYTDDLDFSQLSSGIYFYVLSSGGETVSKKMTLIR